jgi:hypothetical protein
LAKAFLEQYRFNSKSILEYLGLKDDEEPYIIPDLGANEVIMEIEGKEEMSSLPTLTEEEEEKQTKPPPTYDLNVTIAVEEEEEKTEPPPTYDLNVITTTNEGEEELTKPPPPENSTTTEEVRTDPAVEELSISAITTKGDSPTLLICCC